MQGYNNYNLNQNQTTESTDIFMFLRLVVNFRWSAIQTCRLAQDPLIYQSMIPLQLPSTQRRRGRLTNTAFSNMNKELLISIVEITIEAYRHQH